MYSKITFILQPEPPKIRTMENLIFLLATSFAIRLNFPRTKNYLIGNTGCSALLLPDADGLDKTTTTSGDDLYFHESTEGEVTFGMICVQLKNEYELDEAGEMLANYMDKLRGPFFILHHTGQQPCPDWNCETSLTMVDYWQDADGRDWKIKGYTDGRTLAVLYVKNIAETEVKKQDLFLDSFHFGSR